MIKGQNFFDKKNNIWTCNRKIAIGQADDYTTACILDYNYFNKYYKIIAIDLSKQQAIDVDQKAIQKINFTENLTWGEDVNDNTTIFLIRERTLSM